MTSVVPVPQTAGDTELDAGDARACVARCGLRPLVKQSVIRFRYGDGFSSARALALQLCLTVLPLIISMVGLTSTLISERTGQALRDTLLALTPGASDQLVRGAVSRSAATGYSPGPFALGFGLAFAVVSLITAMGQIERGANRIYGIRRDRPTLRKYGRATVLAVVAGAPTVAGVLLLTGGAAAAAAAERFYGIPAVAVTGACWLAGAVLMLTAVTILMRTAPRRRQPGWSWLALGAGVAVVAWLGFTGLLAGYVQLSATFDAVYGPLTAIVALLLWAQLTSVALFFGLAVAAQLEAFKAGFAQAAAPDADPDTGPASGPVGRTTRPP